jgi:hypothetical protein
MTVAAERYAPTALAPGRARRFVESMLRRWRCHDVADTANLLTSEVVSDAVRQAPTDVAVRVEADDAVVRVEVSEDPGILADPDEGAFERRTARQVMRSLASRWGSDQDLNRTTTWFEIERDVDQGTRDAVDHPNSKLQHPAGHGRR